MNILGVLTEGGQTWAHRVRMLRQVFKLATYISLIVSLIVFVALMLNLHPGLYQAPWYYLKASALEMFFNDVSVDPVFWEKISNESYPHYSELLINSSKVISYTEPYVFIFLDRITQFLIISLKVSCVSNLVILSFFLVRGRLSKGKRHISGRKKVSSLWLAFRLWITRKASPIKIGRVPLVKGTETQHILVSGGTGSGKTNCFHHILPQIRKMGQKAVIVDTTGAFIERYYREGKDVILNPFEKEGSPWHPWVECVDKFDFDSIAESFIPQSYSQNENYWRVAARSLFSALLQKFYHTERTSDLTQWLIFEPLPNLCKFVQGTKAGAHIDMSSEKTAGSIRSVAASFLDCLENVKDTEAPFSIRDWVKDEKTNSWLFFYSRPSQRATLNPLLSCWFSVAARSLMQMSPDLNRRLWFVIDELASLNRLKDIENFLAESRKYGGCGLFAFQSPAQLEAIYGHTISKTIIGNCMTKVVFAEQDPQISELISKSFGEREIKEYQEGLSYGAHETRDGVNLSLQSRNLPLVSPSDIQSLTRNEAFLKLPGKLPVAKVKLSIAK